MSLRKKTMLIIGITLIGLLPINYLAISTILLDGFRNVEDKDVRDETQFVVDAVSNQVQDLNDSTRDWAGWDDTYAFIEDHNEGYVRSNLEMDSSSVNMRVNVMMFVNSSGQIVFSKQVDLNEKKAVPVASSISSLAADKALTSFNGPANSVSGILMLPEGAMMICSQPILPSDRNGPIRGALIWGRFLDSAQLEKLAKATHLSVSMRPVGDPNMPQDFEDAQRILSSDTQATVKVLDSNTIAGYSEITDIHGVPALVLRVDNHRTIFQQGQVTMHYLIYSIMAVGFVFGSGTVLLLEISVLSRTARLSTDLGKITATGDHQARVQMNGRDELTNLAGDINSMLAVLEKSQQQLREAHDDLGLKVQERTRELQDKVAVLKTLTEIGREVTGATKPREILTLVCRRVVKLLQAPKCLIVINEGDRCNVVASVGLHNAEAVHRDLNKLLANSENGKIPSARSEPFAVNDMSGLIPPGAGDLHEGIQSLAVAPLATETRDLGLLMVLDSSPRSWATDEIQVLHLLAVQAALALEEAQLFEEERSRREELGSLYELSRSLVETPPDIQTIANVVARHAAETTHVTFACVSLFDEEGKCTIMATHPLRHIEPNPITGLGGKQFCREIMDHDKAVILRPGMPLLAKIEEGRFLPFSARSLCMIPLRKPERFIGVIILGEDRSEEREPLSPEKVKLAESIAAQTISALSRAELFSQLEHSYLETVLSLARAVEAKDTYTADHADNLAAMALAVGRELALTENDLDELRYGAMLHDIGKIGIHDSILQKPGELSVSEWARMKEHPDIGAKILAPVPRLKGATLIVRHHHERFDGKGYPDGLAGEAIPTGARILSVVDAYSAIVDKRVYKEARSHAEAVAEMRKYAGTQFDPRIVDVFLRLIEAGELAV